MFQAIHVNISIATSLAGPMNRIRNQMVPSVVTNGNVQMNLFVMEEQDGVTFQNSLESALTRLSEFDNKNWYTYFLKYLNKLFFTSLFLAECAENSCDDSDLADLMYETRHYLNRVSYILNAVNSGNYKNQNPPFMWGIEDFYHIYVAKY
jgi:hypothetical protein